MPGKEKGYKMKTKKATGHSTMGVTAKDVEKSKRLGKMGIKGVRKAPPFRKINTIAKQRAEAGRQGEINKMKQDSQDRAARTYKKSTK